MNNNKSAKYNDIVRTQWVHDEIYMTVVSPSQWLPRLIILESHRFDRCCSLQLIHKMFSLSTASLWHSTFESAPLLFFQFWKPSTKKLFQTILLVAEILFVRRKTMKAEDLMITTKVNPREFLVPLWVQTPVFTLLPICCLVGSSTVRSVGWFGAFKSSQHPAIHAKGVDCDSSSGSQLL